MQLARKYHSFWRLCLSFLFFIPISTFTLASEWERVGIDNGVEVFRKEIPDSPLVGFKGVKVMDLPVTKIAQVLIDRNPESYKKWIDRIKDFVILEESIDSAITYVSYSLPWPIKSRDYVIDNRLIIDNVNHKMIITMQSTEHLKAPPTLGIRANLIDSRYELSPLSHDRTKVSVEIVTDPRGSIPSWLVNLIQKGWPANTLNSLERQASLPSTGHNEMIQRELKVLQQYTKK